MKKCAAALFILISYVISSLTIAEGLPASVSGRISSSFYSWESRTSDSSSRDLRFYQLALLNIRSSDFLLHLNAIGSSKLTDNGKARNSYSRLRSAYLKWGSKGFDLKLGRQPVWESSGVGVIDGLRGSYVYRGLYSLKAYFGIDPDTWDGEKKYFVGLSSTAKYKSNSLNLNFVRSSIGDYSNNILGVSFRGEAFKRLSGYLRSDLHIPDYQIKRAEAMASWVFRKGSKLSLSFDYRIPIIDPESIFSVFPVEPSRTFAVRYVHRLPGCSRCRVDTDISVFAEASRIFYRSDSSERYSFGFFCRYLYITYRKGMGYGGEIDGISLSLIYPSTGKISPRFSFNFARYALEGGTSDRENVISASIGTRYRVFKYMSLDLQGEVLRNRVYSRDIRGFLKVDFWFFRKAH